MVFEVVDCMEDRKGKYNPIVSALLVEQTMFIPTLAGYVNTTLRSISDNDDEQSDCPPNLLPELLMMC
jgi:hypothetical protein